MNNEHHEPEADDSRKERELIEAARLQNVRPESDGSPDKTQHDDTTRDVPGFIVPSPGTVIGAYKLLEKIGEGGFGVVYAAEQKEPIRRKVALKIIKPGMDTKEVIARFEAERQALALMEHPNIAHVLDAGATPSGHPYFVMELVRGVAITEYCDQRKLNIAQRLDLFVLVCHAVQHAHHKGIIHRDIKPRNVMVEAQNDTAVPKIIDFGVAKATNQQLTEHTVHTLQAQIIGTPMYMSPEQAGRSGLDVDMRTDVYSLGILLYELLTGATPVEKSRLQMANAAELIQIICHEEPTKPSTRIDETNDSVSTVSDQRSTEPAKLRQLLRGDLDWIVLKALEKDRTRRYETVNGLAADIKRYLKDEPVLASPPTAGYRLRKFARRNKVAFLTGSVVAISLVVTAVVSIWMAILANEQFQREKEAREEVTNQKQIAETKSRETSEALFDSFYSQAQASRWSRRPGQRVGSLNALSEAAKLRRELGYDQSEILKLRNEAIASMGLIDLKKNEQHTFELPRPDSELTFDPQHKYYACLTPEGNISVREFAGHREIELLKIGVSKNLNAIRQFSPDGRYLAGHYPAGVCWIWDRSTDEVTYIRETVSGNPGLIKTFSFSGNGQYLAIALRNGSVGLFDPSGRRKIDVIPVATSRLELNFEGDKLAIRRSDKTDVVEIWDIPSRAMVQELSHPASVKSMAWCPNGRWLACAADKKYTVHLWNCNNWEEHAVLRGHKNGGLELRFSHDGRILSSWGWDRVTRLWDPVDGHQLVNVALRLKAFSADDGQVILVDANYKVGIWDVVTKPVARRTLISIDQPQIVFRSADFSSDGRILAIAANGANGGIYFFEVYSGRLTAAIYDCEATSVYFHPSLDSFLSFGSDGLLRWPISASANNTVLQIGPPERVSSSEYGPLIKINLDQSADGNRLVAADGPHSMSVLDMENVDRQLSIKRSNIDFVTISPDGNWVAAGNRFGAGVNVWNANTGQFVKDVWPGSLSASAFFDRRGKYLAACRNDEYRFYEVGTWELIPELTQKKIGSWTVAFSHNGDIVAVTKGGEDVLLLDLDSGAEIATIGSPLNRGNLESLRFSPDDSHLVTVFRNAVEIWDLRQARSMLAEMGLDWDLPSLPPENKKWTDAVPQIELETGIVGAVSANRRAWHLAASADTTPENVAEAIELAESNVKYQPNAANYLNTLGVAYYRARRWDDAIDALNRSDQFYDGGLFSWNGFFLAMAHWQGGDKELAEKWHFASDLWRRKHYPDDAELRAFRDESKSLLEITESPEAQQSKPPDDVELCTAVLAANPRSRWALKRRAESHNKQKHYDQAVADYSTLIELEPRESAHWLKRAENYDRWGRAQDAVNDFDEAIRLSPEFVTAWHSRGHALQKLRSWDEAVDSFSQAVKLNPNQWTHWRCRGMVRADRGQWNDALSDFSKVIEVRDSQGTPPTVWNWFELSISQLAIDDRDGYRNSCDQMLERFGDSKVVRKVAYVAWACALHPDATRDYAQPLVLARMASQSWTPISLDTIPNAGIDLGAILYRAEQFDVALQKLVEANRRLPEAESEITTEHIYCWLFLAMTHKKLKQHDQAQHMLAKTSKWIDERLGDDLPENAAPLPWTQQVTLKLLRREATSLIGE